MAVDTSLSERKLTILKAIIQNYLETGEPVGSRTLSKYTDLNLSSATIRNEMADLEDRMKAERRVMHIDATIICERDSHKGIIIGKQGSMLKKIGSNARFEIEKMLEERVNLKIWVKVKKDWRDSDTLMKNFGYNKKEI